jgi:hypothetical protein
VQIQSINHLKQHKTHPNNSLHFCLSLDLSEVLVWVLPVSSVTQQTTLLDKLPTVTGKEMTRRVRGAKVLARVLKCMTRKINVNNNKVISLNGCINSLTPSGYLTSHKV